MSVMWPEIVPEHKPWTRWWWLGSAVDRHTITQLLEEYQRVGLGGVEVTPVYGVRGMAKSNIEYLSDEWLEMLRHTVAEAKRLGMQVDLPPGSGWRIGGGFITDETSAAQLSITKTKSGYTIASVPSDEMVKRAGPGGTGRAFNPFSRASLQAVIEHFTSAFMKLGIRAQFHDSWEYGSNASPELLNTFQAKRGYDLPEHLPELEGDKGEEVQARVKYDLQLTLAEMALENFIIPWSQWSRELGQLSRNQAHGSPGNWLDLYAACDIPETEVFRTVTPDTPLMSKFASSAAHVAGRRLVSSETATWLKEHFHVSLADVKLLVDNLFVSGINHHVYHGTAYSPPGARWPGWLFYASTQFNPQNTIWRDVPVLNAYVTRCQSVLQDGRSDNDVLVYFPIHDVLHDAARPPAALFTIEGEWLRQTIFVDTYRRLWQRGFCFDYISDRQIETLRVAGDGLSALGGVYRVLVVPPCRYMPVDTLADLVRLAEKGVNVVFASPGPSDVPGYAQLAARHARFNKLMEGIDFSGELENALAKRGVERERMADLPGILFIRRRHESGHLYFIANQGETTVDSYIPLTVSFESALIMDAMSGTTGMAQMRGKNPTSVRIQLAPGESLIIKTFSSANEYDRDWDYVEIADSPIALGGPWAVTFIEGGPELPDAYETDVLESWTERDTAAERFSGTAVYRTVFDAPGQGTEWLLDLGRVHASARVRLNGCDAGTLIGPAFSIRLSGVQPTGNVLEIEVTNLAANRIRDLDRRNVDWRIFEDVNFVTRDYGPFDAGEWPIMPSGLLGPVTLAKLSD